MSPALLPRLLAKLSDMDANFDEVVEIIAFDPSLTSKLLQICNSAYFGHASEVNSVAEAVSRIGYQAVYLLVAMINGSNCFPQPSPQGVDAVKLWQHSVLVAFYAKFVAESAEVDGNLLFTAGLLHDLGKIILGQKQPAQADLFHTASDAASLAREQTAFGCTHAEVGAALLADWKLPAGIVEAVRHHHAPGRAGGQARRAACVSLADLIAHNEESPQITQRQEFTEALGLVGLAPDLLKHWDERLRDHQSMISGMSRLPF